MNARPNPETTIMTMAADYSPPLITPPTVSSPEQPLSTLRFLAAMIRNPLEAWPRSVCETSMVVQNVAGEPIAFVADPELLKFIFAPDTELFAKNPLERRLYGPLMGDSLLTSHGAQWRWQRRTTAPLFRHVELFSQVPQMGQAAERILAKWRASGASSVQPIDPVMMRATFEVVATALLPEESDFEKSNIERWTSDFLAGATWDMVYAILGAPSWMPHPRRRKAQAGARNIRRAIGSLIERRRNRSQPGTDLLGRLLTATDPASGQPMSHEHVLDNVIGFMLAGHETTYSALTWALYLLALHPEWQTRVRREVADVTGGQPVTADHLGKLALCQQVLKETMRLYPPAPLLSRVCTRDIRLGGRDFKAGTMFFVPVYAIHRHRRLWRDADAFDPSRFEPDMDAGRPRYAYLPWGAGPRICIGAAFSLIEATVILATMAQRAWFDPVDRQVPIPQARITLRPKNTLYLHVTLNPETERLTRHAIPASTALP